MFLCIFLLSVRLPAGAGLEEQPSWLWLNAYVLVQTSEQLGGQHVWPLALAGYTAAHSHFQDIADRFPDFQPRLVAYRLKDLEARIQSAQNSMNAGDHDLSMMFADFLETSDLASRNRMSLEFPAAYEQLARAQWQLSEVIRSDPDNLGAIFARQREHLRSVTEQIRDELLRRPDGAQILFEVDRRYSGEIVYAPLELPGHPEVPVTANLFP